MLEQHEEEHRGKVDARVEDHRRLRMWAMPVQEEGDRRQRREGEGEGGSHVLVQWSCVLMMP